MYKINEVFLSVQGEGPQVGCPAIFVRFAKCNLACTFCDTEHETHDNYKLERLLGAVFHELGDRSPDGFPVVLTGGEPLLQLDDDLVEALHAKDFKVHIETNGMEDTYLSAKQAPFEYLGKCDEVVVSPKGADWSEQIVKLATAIKLVVPLPDGLDMSDLDDLAGVVGSSRLEEFEPGLFLQPITPSNYTKPHNMPTLRAHCLRARNLSLDMWAAYQQAWRVVPQAHVFMGFK